MSPQRPAARRVIGFILGWFQIWCAVSKYFPCGDFCRLYLLGDASLLFLTRISTYTPLAPHLLASLIVYLFTLSAIRGAVYLTEMDIDMPAL